MLGSYRSMFLETVEMPKLKSLALFSRQKTHVRLEACITRFPALEQLIVYSGWENREPSVAFRNQEAPAALEELLKTISSRVKKLI